MTRFHIVIAHFLLLVFAPHAAVWGLSPTEALLLLTKSFANASALESWATESSPPCGGSTNGSPASPWMGVVCFKGIVTGLHLPNMGLSGNIDVEALSALPGLRSVSLVNNSFSGRIPDLHRLGALKSVYLTGNRFSGDIPDGFFLKMKSLKKVYLDSNAFSGAIPSSLAAPPRLMELHLEDNQFGGKLPDLRQLKLKTFNVSNNPNLEGKIPLGLERFGMDSFNGDHNLCGKVVGKECRPPPSIPAPASAPAPAPAPVLPIIPAKETASAVSYSKMDPSKSKIIGGVLAIVLCVLTVAALAVRQLTKASFDTLRDERRRRSVKGTARFRSADGGGEEDEEEVFDRRSSLGHFPRKSYSRSSSRRSAMEAATAPATAELVVVNEERGVFGLPDLMKAAAEVLSNSGGLGAAYKAMIASGITVVVKRMREMNREGPEGFEVEMRRLGHLRHPNVLSPLAFLYRKEEKLLIYEYIPGGSLFHLLHEKKSDEHIELDWRARLKIIRGVAKGLGYLHTELSKSDLPHGNVKSSNIFLGSNMTPILADFGYFPLLLPVDATATMFAYKSPEALQYRHVTSKSDVFCFGIVLLEIVSGKCPSQYNNEGETGRGTDLIEWATSAVTEGKETELFDPKMAVDTHGASDSMRKLLQLGVACVEANFKMRPDMSEVVRRIDEIAESSVAEGVGVEIIPVEGEV